ncbi:MAG: GNAT family N-acetyltransferase [Pseudomonadota bacterium]
MTKGEPMGQTTIPVVLTDRLVMRAPQQSDFEAYARFFADPQSEPIGGPVPKDVAWRKLATVAGHWMLRGYGMWALEEKSTGDFAGLCGPWFPDGWTEPEIGWSLMLGKTGKGYATEAALAARDFAYSVLGWHTAISLIAPDNHASKRVAERLGAHFEEIRTIPYHGGSLTAEIFRHPGPKTLARRAETDQAQKNASKEARADQLEDSNSHP